MLSQNLLRTIDFIIWCIGHFNTPIFQIISQMNKYKKDTKLQID